MHRLPFAHVIHDDEAFYSTVAARWLRGDLPYVPSFDIKAPGLFALFAAVQTVFGASLVTVKGLELAFTVLGAPKARYFNAMHLLCNFPTPETDPLGAAFAAWPKYVVMSDDGVALSCAQGSRLLRVCALLARDYVRPQTGTGAWERFDLYRRKEFRAAK